MAYHFANTDCGPATLIKVDPASGRMFPQRRGLASGAMVRPTSTADHPSGVDDKYPCLAWGGLASANDATERDARAGSGKSETAAGDPLAPTRPPPDSPWREPAATAATRLHQSIA
jgi:hypothetical protein